MDSSPSSFTDAPAYKDRRTGLIIFGVCEIILGALCALMVPLSVFGQVMLARQQNRAFDLTTTLQGLSLFVVLAVGFIWLGIGSLQARRWARALLLCLGGIGLVVGVLALALLVGSGMLDMIGKKPGGQELPPGALLMAKIVAMAVLVVMYVVIPGALVLFYRSRHVKLTCEHRDPVARWTDRCPLPVLALCILQAYGGCAMLLSWKFSAAVPFFGFIVTGWIARLLWLGATVFMLYAADKFYRLDRRTWVIYLVFMGLAALSGLISFARIDLLDYYRAVGLPEWQIQQIAATPLVQGNNFLWLCGLSFLPFGGYLLYLRRYFVDQPSANLPPA